MKVKPHMTETFRCVPFDIQLSELPLSDGQVPERLQIFRCGTYFHPEYGKFEITPDTLKAFKKNFDDRVRRIDIALDYGHNSEAEAAAWFTNVELSEDGTELYAVVDWTPDGKDAVAQKKYRYISPDFTFNYQDNEKLTKFGPTLLGAGLTNRPVIKAMEPVVNLSEMKGNSMSKKAAPAAKAEPEKKLDPAQEAGDQADQKKDAPISADESADNAEESAEDAADESEDQDMQSQIAALQAQVQDLMSKVDALTSANTSLQASEKKSRERLELAEKNTKFDKLLSEGKAVEAQREAYMTGDIVKFSELSSKVNLEAKGSGAAPAGAGAMTREEASAEISRLATVALSEKRAKDLSQAISLVLSEKKDLAAIYNGKEE